MRRGRCRTCVPPSDRLEVLKRERRGQHSIRINDKWRICFVWRDGDAHDVEIARTVVAPLAQIWKIRILRINRLR